MPIATGKSTLLLKLEPSGVQEADDICLPRGTKELAESRDAAWKTGDWSGYDKLLSSEIRRRAKPDTSVVLLAASDLAISLELKIIGAYVLEQNLWTCNMMKRGEKVEKYLRHYHTEIDNGAIVCESYKELEERVIYAVERTKQC